MTGKSAAFFASTGLVARLERAECGLILACAEAVRRRDPRAC